ncbi:MAG: SBBP repeat-containing protein [Bacteroidetes bacterium]|nr:SBBP repeat-containing protein [Bacteroidota bacterium]
MKKIYLGFIIAVLSTTTQAQSVKLEWAKSTGATLIDYGESIAIDAVGNVYVTGYFSVTVDFDPGAATFNLTSNGSEDVFIQKLDASGNFIWAKSIGGPTYPDRSFSINVDISGNVLISGYYYGTVDFDPGAGTFNLTSNGGADIFILKLDSGGNFIWAKSIGGTTLDASQCITTDSSGNVYLIGYFSNTIDFDPGAGTFSMTPSGLSDIYILKLSGPGNFIWAKSMGGSLVAAGKSLNIDVWGNVLLTGYFSGTVDFDPSGAIFNLVSNGGDDVFIQKLDSAGNFKWAASIGGISGDQSFSIATDTSGNALITGRYGGTVDFDPDSSIYNLTTNGASDVFVLKLDTSGKLIWAKSMGGPGFEEGHSINCDASSNVYLTGFYDDTADFDPGVDTFNLMPSGFTDIFVQKLDTGGSFIWAIKMGGSKYEYGRSIITDAAGKVYVTGRYEDLIDFDPDTTKILNLNSNGGADIFILKLGQCYPNTGTDIIIACDSTYTWIDGNTYTISNNTATDTLINMDGCDSIVTLNLTITIVDGSVTTKDPSITANAT